MMNILKLQTLPTDKGDSPSGLVGVSSESTGCSSASLVSCG